MGKEMFYSTIKSVIDESEFIKNFDSIILDRNKKVLFHKLNRSVKSLLLARAFMMSGKNIIFITADDKLAEEYLDDLDLLIGHDHSFFLPDYEVIPYEERSPHYTIRAQRITTLAQAVSGNPAIYSCSFRSFLRKIVPSKTLKKNIITIEKGSEYEPDLLISKLIGMGYSNEYQVSKVGDVARRGGIIDVFCPDSVKPVRLEYFGDEVETIRVFSVSSQLSTGEEPDSVTFVPAREFAFDDISNTSIEKFQREGFYEGIELDVSLLLSETESFGQYFLPENCLLFWDEYQFFSSYLNEIYEETTNLWQKAKSNKRTLPRPEDLFAGEKYISKLMHINSNHFFSSSDQDFPGISYRVEAPIKNQENLYGELEKLEYDLKEKIADNYTVFIQSDNKSQSTRMRDLLPDFDENITFSIGVFQKGFILTDIKLAIFTDHEIFSRYKRKRKHTRFAAEEALVDYESLKPGDYVVHIDHGVGIYTGLKKINIDGNSVEYLHLKYAGNDAIYVPTFQLSLVSKFVSEEGIAPNIHKIGGKRWEQSKRRAKRQIELIAEDLVKLYAERKLRKGIVFDSDTTWQKELENSFIYEDTPDQKFTSKEIKIDMESDSPMERLLCGDVGFGKTEVAIRAAFKAVMSGWQVAILVPTTLLAEQHFLVFSERIAQYPVKIAMFSRFRSQAKIKKDVIKLSTGEIDIAIGTHRLFSKDIKYKKLGLLIIDEEHRFGVRHKDKLRKLKANVDTLYMSATPIPRTMYMALSKLKELSLIRTSPKARLPIRTVIVPFDEEIIKDAINREIDRGGQVFFVHNRVQTIESIASNLRKLLPNIRFVIGHGQLPEKQLEAITLDFAHHKYDVLIATTIIESGLDIPNANTIIINRADMFGLAQLYQIRGRVGRSNRRAYAYLMIPAKLTIEARKRLETLTEYESLGSGYQIAMKDLEIRGAGALLGTKQSGIINTIGFNYYNRLLEKAVNNIQSEKRTDIWEDEEENEPSININSDYFLPEKYVYNEKERLRFYKKMIRFAILEDFDNLRIELKDRFGTIPEQAENSIIFYKIRFLAKKNNLISLNIKKNRLILEFDNKKLPSQDFISQVIRAIDYPVNFDTTGNMKMIFDLKESDISSKSEVLDKCLNILMKFENN